MKKLMILILLFASVLSLTSCVSQENVIVGSWVQNTTRGSQLQINNRTYTVYYNSSIESLTFSKDGQVNYGGLGLGLYSISNGKLSIQTILGDVETYPILKLNNETLVLSQYLYDTSTGEDIEVCYVYSRP